MAEAVANVARRINATVEDGKDSLGETPLTNLSPYLPLTLSAVSQHVNEGPWFNILVDAVSVLAQQVVTEA